MLPESCSELLGMVTASCCLSKSLPGDIRANLKNWTIGGELQSYTELMDRATERVLQRLKTRATALNARYVIGVRLTTTQVSEGAAELIAYGTAVK